ncbi:MAG: hypothetical protein DIU62_007095 [Pseudomonadota bacterium]|jgi:hypothetical protein|nr:MAG: hypothetical protein DIU62_08385 [Pseudomonadota bacterium]
MKKTAHYVAGLAAALLAAPALAGGIDGRWNATVDGGPAGPVELTFDLKSEGEKLTGALVMAMMPDPVAISDGVVKGEDVSFTLAFNMMEGMPPMVIKYSGKVKGDELNLTSVIDMGQGPMETPVVAKRAK